MIYLETNQHDKLIILEPRNIARMKAGEPIVTPDGTITITYTPDLVWLSEQMTANRHHLDGAVIKDLLEEGSTRPENTTGLIYPVVQLIKDGKQV